MQNYILDKQRLILCREKLNITKQEAARRMQMSQPAYLRYESGDRLPSIHIIQTMANVLGTSIEYLTGQTDDSKSTCYLIEKTSEPELFYAIDVYKKCSKDDQNRFLEYVKKCKIITADIQID